MQSRAATQTATEARAARPARRYDVDWLRVLATLTIFFFHCARFFDPIDWHLKNAEHSTFLTLFVVLLATWEMPLFFLLSGIGSWYALKSRNGGQYLFERVKRLLVPFYTVGIFLLLPPQFYMDFVTHKGYRPSYWDMIPPYFKGDSLELYFRDPYITNLWPGHLWFLQFLFIVSLVTLPLLLYLRSQSGQRLVGVMAGWCHRRGGIFLFLVPLILVRIGLRSFFAGEHTWADLFEYAIFFLIGYLIPADERFTESYRRDGWLGLVLGLAGVAGGGYMFLSLGYNPMEGEAFSGTYVLFQTVWGTASWGMIVFILSLGARYMNFTNKVLSYANETVLPFYILHQTVILLVGWFIIPLDLSILVKYLTIASASFVIIMALYELLIRRFNVLRFLFGMRLKKKRPAALVVEEGAQGG
jgi:glucan biosynthesis protein C